MRTISGKEYTELALLNDIMKKAMIESINVTSAK